MTSFALYEAYGTRPYEWSDGVTGDPDRQKANTKEEEKDLGLLNEGMRFRDLETGTFLTRDPIGFADGPNVYCYVHCNPITKFDALGLNQEEVDETYEDMSEDFEEMEDAFDEYNEAYDKEEEARNEYNKAQEAYDADNNADTKKDRDRAKADYRKAGEAFESASSNYKNAEAEFRKSSAEFRGALADHREELANAPRNKSTWQRYRSFQNELGDTAKGMGNWGVEAGLASSGVSGAWFTGAKLLFQTGNVYGYAGGVVFTGVGLFCLDSGVSLMRGNHPSANMGVDGITGADSARANSDATPSDLNVDGVKGADTERRNR